MNKKIKKGILKGCIGPDYIHSKKHIESCSRGGGQGSFKMINYLHKNGKIIRLQSTYEVIVAKDLDKNNIEWTRPKSIFWLDKENKKHRYYPDFYLPEYNVYLDPKNDWNIIKGKEKIERVIKQNNIKLLIINKDNLNWECIKNMIKSHYI